MRRVILFKSSENSGKYVSAFEEIGCEVLFLPVLEFKFTNLDSLLDKLNNDNRYEGLVLTSQRAVEAITECIRLEKDKVVDKWKKKRIFVVGEMTNDKLAEELCLHGCGEDSGNANELSDFIVKENCKITFTKPLLFPCGNLKSETLPTKLNNNDIGLDTVVVYVTQENTSIKKNLIELKKTDGIPLDMVFFSPSGVSFVLPILRDIGYNFDNCNLIAIGPSTEKKVIEMGFNIASTAMEPTPYGLISCFKKINNNN